MARTEIKYNNSFPFSGQPTPFVGRVKNNIVAGERWGAEESWTLAGQLTGCDFEDLTTAQLNLINSFAQDYKELKIVEYEEFESITVGETGTLGFEGVYKKISATRYEKVDSDTTILYRRISDGKWVFAFEVFSFPFISLDEKYISTTSSSSPTGLTYTSTGVPSGDPPFPTVSDSGIINQEIEIQKLNFVEIDSIQFQSNKYVKILPYTINLSCYPSGYFTGSFGVLDPTNRWELVESRDRSINLTHTLSARGFNTSDSQTDALENAKDWVLARTGFSDFPTPEFITKYSASGVLLSQNETINRLEGIYGVTESYVLDGLNSCDYGFLRFTVENSAPQAGFQTVSINGSIQGGLHDDFSLLRNRLQEFDFYSQALHTLDSGINLNPTPINKQVVENESARTINFSYAYDDNQRAEINYDYTLAINSGESNITVALNGNVNGRGELKNRYEKADLYFNTYLKPSIFGLAYSGYSGYLAENGYTGTPVLDHNELSSSVSKDKFNGVISFNYEYSDKPTPPNTGLESFDFSLSWTPPIRRVLAEELIHQSGSILSPKYEVTDLGFVSRGIFSLNGSAVPTRDFAITSGDALRSGVENSIRAIYFGYFTGFSGEYLTEFSMGQTNQGLYNFNIGATYEGLDVLNDTGNYTEIVNL
jgi:hypothetical protein